MPAAVPPRPRSTLLTTLLLWLLFYASFTLFRPALLDDADSVHVEVAREMLLRHDPVTLYANGIRYLEKAPLLYWLMALSMRLATLLGAHRPELLAAAARIPLALSVLALALLAESFARHLFRSARAGLYASLILLSSFGIFIFTRITIPDALVCLWITASLYTFWRTETLTPPPTRVARSLSPDKGRGPASEVHGHPESAQLRNLCHLFAATSALNVLTKGLIGIVFPVAIVLLYLLLTRGPRRALLRLRQLHPLTSLLVFLAIAAPWHIAAGLANPTQGHPAPFLFLRDPSAVLPWGHWQIPLPTDGNVRGWWWFYFMNEHLLRYLNLRVPRDYDTVPLALFWGLCLIWLMPWSAFAFKATAWAVPLRSPKWRSQFRRHDLPLKRRGLLLLTLWPAFVLLFFSLSTRQEYYILPALPAAAILIAGWLAQEAANYENFSGTLQRVSYRRWIAPTLEERARGPFHQPHRAALRALTALLLLGTVFTAGAIAILALAKTPPPGTDLATLLHTNPGEYALSMGHFLDLDTRALGLFRFPLILAAASLFGGPLAALRLRTRGRVHASNLALTAGAFTFLFAAHLGLQTFAPVLSSAQLAAAIRPQLHPDDLIVLHGEYEAGSTLGFYLRRRDIHILEGRSSNLWYGSFFPDAPPIFETPATLAAKWPGPQRIFLWQSLTDPPNTLPTLPSPVYFLARSGGKEVVSNRPNR